MNASYVVIGSLLAPIVHFDRLAWMSVVYLLALGVSAHSLDAMAPNKPWGGFLSRPQLAMLGVAALVPACAIGLYFAFSVAPILVPLGLIELFFLLSYNLELFKGAFHTDLWFATSWGFFPVLVGYAVQSDTVSPASLAAGLFGFFTAFVEINASRPYKALRRDPASAGSPMTGRLESVLKGVVASVLATALFLLIRSLAG